MGVTRGLAGLGVCLVLAGCTAGTPPPAPSSTRADPVSPTSSGPAEVIDASGVGQVHIGATLAELTADGLASTAEPGCGPGLSTIPYASPVFDDTGRLVLIWAYPPLRTPEGVTVGTALAKARSAYPDATELKPPARSGQYAGLLAQRAGDLAILLLHDGTTVQKLIVGFEQQARLLFETGFGSC